MAENETTKLPLQLQAESHLRTEHVASFSPHSHLAPDIPQPDRCANREAADVRGGL